MNVRTMYGNRELGNPIPTEKKKDLTVRISNLMTIKHPNPHDFFKRLDEFISKEELEIR